MDESNRRYSDEEVSAIIRRALGQESHRETIDHTELEDIARSSGISPEALRSAIEQEASEGDLDAAKDKWKQHHRREFYRHLTTYCIVNGFLVLVYLMTSRGYFWVVWPMMGWGIGLAFHYVNTFFVSEDTIKRGARRLLRKRQRTLERLQDHD